MQVSSPVSLLLLSELQANASVAGTAQSKQPLWATNNDSEAVLAQQSTIIEIKGIM